MTKLTYMYLCRQILVGVSCNNMQTLLCKT
jgi:hypothetical protein